VIKHPTTQDTGNSITRNTSETGFNRASKASTGSCHLFELASPLQECQLACTIGTFANTSGCKPPATLRIDSPGQPRGVTAFHQISGCTTLSDAIFIDDPFDFVHVSQAADVDLNARLSSRGDTNSSNAQKSLKERLLNLHVPDIAMPNLGDRAAQPTTVQTCSQIGDSQFRASTTEKPDNQKRQTDSNQ
jgi:hypothetical protein